MNKSLRIGFPYILEQNESTPRLIDYPLINLFLKYYLQQGDKIQVHLWKEQQDVIEELELLEACSWREVDANLFIVEFKITKGTTTYFLNTDYLKMRSLKWFTINIFKEGYPIFHCSHWGTELVFINKTEEEIRWIKSLLPNDVDLLEYRI